MFLKPTVVFLASASAAAAGAYSEPAPKPAPTPIPVQQGITMSSTVTLGYGISSLDVAGTDIDFNTFTLAVASDIMFSPSFNLGLDFSFAKTSADDIFPGLDAHLDLIRLDIEPEYRFSNGFYVGAYYHMWDADVSVSVIPGLTLGVDADSMGVFGGYDNGPWGVEAFYGVSDTDPGLGGIADIKDYGLSASYDLSPNFEIFGAAARTSIDFGPGQLDLTMVSLGADYAFDNGLSVYGSLGRIDVGTPFPSDIDVTNYTLGLAYDFAGTGSGVPVSLNLELSRSNLDTGGLLDADVNRIGFGATIPIGGGSNKSLDSNTRAARGDYRSVITAIADSL